MKTRLLQGMRFYIPFSLNEKRCMVYMPIVGCRFNETGNIVLVVYFANISTQKEIIFSVIESTTNINLSNQKVDNNKEKTK